MSRGSRPAASLSCPRAPYGLPRFGLSSAHRGSVVGAGAAALSVRLPVYWLLLVVCLLLAVLLLANIVLARSTLLVAGPVLWLILVAVLLGLAPGVYQAVAVKPNELNREHDYLQRQIDSTNQAFALDRVTFKDFTDKQTITTDLLDANPGTVGNLPLWDYSPLRQASGQIQTLH